MRAVDYRESDRIVTLLTPELGSVSAIARGARRSRRRFSGALSPFCLLDVQLTRSRSELFRLEQAQVKRPCMRILAELPRMSAAGALLDMVRRMAAAQAPDALTYHTCVEALWALDSCPEAHIGSHRLAAAARLVALAGWTPDLGKCGLCGRVPGPRQSVLLDAAAGHLVCRRCGGAKIALSAQARAAFAAMLSDGQVEGGSAGADVQQSIDDALDAIVRCHVD